MPRLFVFGLIALIVAGGTVFGLYQSGWWSPAAASGSPSFEQSRLTELRGDIGTIQTISTDMATASDAATADLRDQGHDVTAQACTVSGDIRQLPSDLATFVQQNCKDGEVAPGSEFAESSDGTGQTSNDPDPGSN
jgi:hypothetical protein